MTSSIQALSNFFVNSASNAGAAVANVNLFSFTLLPQRASAAGGDSSPRHSASQSGEKRVKTFPLTQVVAVALLSFGAFPVFMTFTKPSVGGEGPVMLTGPRLQACLKWSSEDPSLPLKSMPELRKRLECHGALMESGLANDDMSQALFARSRQLVTMSHTLQRRSKAVAETLLALHQQSNSVPQSLSSAVDAFSALQKLEVPFRETLATMEQGIDVLRRRLAVGDFDAEDPLMELHDARSAARFSLLESVREAHSLSLALHRSKAIEKSGLDSGKKGLLAGVLALATLEAEADPDADAKFSAGLYWSEQSVADMSVSVFGSTYAGSAWLPDAEGVSVPAGIAKAEELLLAGEQAALNSVDRAAKALRRAAQLHKHAKFLASLQIDDAAVWRYRAASKLAASHQKLKLAAHSQCRVAQLLVRRNRISEALEDADAALVHDPSHAVAQHLHVTLRLRLGLIRTELEVWAAKKQLSQLESRLPSAELEAQRSLYLTDITSWEKLTDASIWSCFGLGDSARVLICLLCKAGFQ